MIEEIRSSVNGSTYNDSSCDVDDLVIAATFVSKKFDNQREEPFLCIEMRWTSFSRCDLPMQKVVVRHVRSWFDFCNPPTLDRMNGPSARRMRDDITTFEGTMSTYENADFRLIHRSTFVCIGGAVSKEVAWIIRAHDARIRLLIDRGKHLIDEHLVLDHHVPRNSESSPRVQPTSPKGAYRTRDSLYLSMGREMRRYFVPSGIRTTVLFSANLCGHRYV